MLTVVLVVEALIILSILYRVFRAASSPLRSIPGPFLARFTRLWYFGKLHAYNYQETNIALHRRYGTRQSYHLFCMTANTGKGA